MPLKLPFIKKSKPSDNGVTPLPESLRHIAFIMDGNGRWAQKRGMPREYGHSEGAAAFKRIVRYCGDIGVKIVTVYAFSTENWTRPQPEVERIMTLLDEYLDGAERELYENKIRYVFLGDKSVLSPRTSQRMAHLERISEEFELRLNIAFNYGSRAEILHAVRELIGSGEEVTEETLSSHMYTSGCPDPDLIIRTANERRLSNFLLWQSAYSELYFTDTLWPDMQPSDVDAAVADFAGRIRRYGGVTGK